MAELLVAVTTGAVRTALQEEGRTLNYARDHWGLPRRLSDDIKDETRQSVDVPIDILLGLAKGLRRSPFDLTPKGALREVAFLNPSKVGMVQLCDVDEPHMEVLAEPITLDEARRNIQYHKEMWSRNLIPAQSSAASARHDAEVAFLKQIPWLFTPEYAWENTLPTDKVAASGSLLRQVDEDIKSQPKRQKRASGHKQSMEHLVSQAEAARDSQLAVSPDLCFPDHGFRIFCKTVVRQAQPYIDIYGEGVDWDDEKAPFTSYPVACHSFSTFIHHVTHYFVVAPHNAEVVYLTVPPLRTTLDVEELDRSFYNHFEDDESDRADDCDAWLSSLRALNRFEEEAE